jgi:hypothetical protein
VNTMGRVERDDEREERISNRIVVDAYTPEEVVIGWHIYLDEKMSFPFDATCTDERATSPLEEGERVTVVGMIPDREASAEMFVTVEWMDRELGAPLAQLDPTDPDADTAEAIGDWHYWVVRGKGPF